MGKTNDFMELVQLHERAWGMESYPGRPNLQSILNAWIVAFWYPSQSRDHGYRVSIHDDMNTLEKYVSDLLLEGNSPFMERRLVTLFVDKKEIKIKGVKLVFEMVGSQK